MEKMLHLISLYQKEVKYYSVIYNPKFIEITNIIIHNLLRKSGNLIFNR